MIPTYGRRHGLPEDAPPPYPFRFHPAARRLLALLGVHRATSYVVVDDHVLHVCFGPWRITTPVTNVLDVEQVGQLALRRSLGVRCSRRDGGLTLGTGGDGGIVIRFRDPVLRLDARFPIEHPTLTVTLEDPEGFRAQFAAIRRRTRPDAPTGSRTGHHAPVREPGLG